MAACFWYLIKRDLSSVHYFTAAHTSVTLYKVPEQHGHVYPVGLYFGHKREYLTIIAIYMWYYLTGILYVWPFQPQMSL